MTKIGIIVGTTREGRVTDLLAKWVKNGLGEQAVTEVVDLADYPMPFISEPSPRFNPERKATPEVQKWLDKIAEFDSLVIVTPEYNRSIPGVLKNAIDLLDYQLDLKPVAIVAHGSNNGAQAVDALRTILPQVGAVVVPQNVYFSGRVAEVISGEGELPEDLKSNPWGPQAALEGTVKQLILLTEALRSK
jgi:NAD(P)H-dependent FMN reductase